MAAVTPFDYSVRLWVKHPSADPDEVAAAFAMTPSHAWKVGEPRVSPTGLPLGGVRAETYCNFQVSEGYDGELASCMSDVLSRLEARGTKVQALKATGCTIQFYVFWYPNGDTGAVFDASLLSRMAALGIDLGINVYDDRNSPPAS